jgi:hypothetical protein
MQIGKLKMTKLQIVGSLEALCDSNNKHSGIAHLTALFGGLFYDK